MTATADCIFREGARREMFEILAQCYMPDHLHLVVEGRHLDADLIRFIKDAKQRSGYWHVRQFQSPLWQVGWFDHIIRDNESIERHVCYTLANPVRAGLVDCWHDWPYSTTAIDVCEADFCRALRTQA